ncbi:MAG TPA: 2-phosphosulfolactate phosphatase [Pseudonocardia sp.]|uniref:2-phosphosulfolactate phosphatase n=1 Tax=Pseudonocardia sp. TaxID=60912 RepID=UPI002BB7CA12|nr:2-phosphosulfolactate phosphatase [Pseudonocardia sp.]HTF48619.1 2-phosphosulfolactate phosphatase [Pseudonocardia sp.]
MDWGPSGASAVAPGCAVVVVVDVLSFTTTLSVAMERGLRVFPFRVNDTAAAMEFAAARHATLAVPRSKAGPGEVSLSPQSVRAAPADLLGLVLPSPNGSTLSAQLAATGATVLGASLRNPRAVAAWLLRERARQPGLNVAVIAAGERWPDGTLRPAVEDQWGAGAVLDALHEGGWLELSPEAAAAAASYRAVAEDVGVHLRACASGRELIDSGYPEDVGIAAELDLTDAVPVRRDGAFVRD